ncbi:hypothetical protein [Prauserella muralis]|uniref:hypothetical protein n=1 Tax=Prauserella muralis TaxID=588067 RepID=UPI0011AD2C25|nr:hypothetical protein [Prauserella muralis]TWE27439.1 hypothetical protein FHX69_0070 [Prauserella muralis]
MTTPHDPRHPTHDPAKYSEHQRPRGHGGHRWLLIACCVPMIAIAIALVATGVVSSGFLVVAVICVVMMALMHGGMGHGGGRGRSR